MSEVWNSAVARQIHASLTGRCQRKGKGGIMETVPTPCKPEGCKCEVEIQSLATHLNSAAKFYLNKTDVSSITENGPM